MYEELSEVWIMAYTTIDDPSAYFHTQLYTGTGSELSVTNNANAGDFKPDWIWIKQRNAVTDHGMFDSSRGVTKNLKTNTEDAESTEVQSVKTFNTDGFTLGTSGDYNGSSDTHVAWQWKANGGSTTSFNESGNNPGGTIQTNTDAGFSIITTTGTGGAGTIAHGLGAVPHWIISKCRSNSGGWVVYHQANTSAPETDALNLSSTGATVDAVAWFNDTAPTSSVFTVGTTGDLNGDGRTNIHYVFTEKQGYSKFGSYTGNGNADGPFVYTGFKPAWVMIKLTSSTENWIMMDNKRDTFNNAYRTLLANASSTEDTSNDARYSLDFVSNGFKVRSNAHATSNGNGSTYIYMAFAESPFVSSKGVPTTAR
jgi:hypothetical protein